MLGVGADIHLGQFDDISYMKELRQKEMLDSQIEKEEKEDEIKKGISGYMGNCLEMYPRITTEPAINQQFKKDSAHISREYSRLGRDPTVCIDKIREEVNAQKSKLNGAK